MEGLGLSSGMGAALGAAAGAAIGSIVSPLCAAIAAAFGAVSWGLAGRELALAITAEEPKDSEAVTPTQLQSHNVEDDPEAFRGRSRDVYVGSKARPLGGLHPDHR